jgi:hypothetical protein
MFTTDSEENNCNIRYLTDLSESYVDTIVQVNPFTNAPAK